MENDILLNDQTIILLKQKIFNIVSDYEIDHVVLDSSNKKHCNRKFLYQIAKEYRKKFQGDFLIKY